MKRTQTESEIIFINNKIEREKGTISFVADGSHIVWIIGYRISFNYRIDGMTKRVIKIQMNGGSYERKIRVLLSEEEVDERICQIAKQISKDYAEKRFA